LTALELLVIERFLDSPDEARRHASGAQHALPFRAPARLEYLPEFLLQGRVVIDPRVRIGKARVGEQVGPIEYLAQTFVLDLLDNAERDRHVGSVKGIGRGRARKAAIARPLRSGSGDEQRR